MRLLAVGLFLFTLATAANAQTPQSTVQQIISMHSNVEAQLAEQLDQARAQIQKLTAENEALKKSAEKKPEEKAKIKP